jgi:hypothetical protein
MAETWARRLELAPSALDGLRAAWAAIDAGTVDVRFYQKLVNAPLQKLPSGSYSKCVRLNKVARKKKVVPPFEPIMEG